MTNKLTLNAFKTEYGIFGTKTRKTKPPEIELAIGGTILKEAETYKYLGTTLDANLTVNPQLLKLNQTIAMKIKTFRRMRDFISENTEIQLYKALILPIIDYNDIIYDLLNKEQEIKLQRIQNRALRTVFKGKHLSTQEMHDKAQVETLAIRRKIHMLGLMYKRAKDRIT